MSLSSVKRFYLPLMGDVSFEGDKLRAFYDINGLFINLYFSYKLEGGKLNIFPPPGIVMETDYKSPGAYLIHTPKEIEWLPKFVEIPVYHFQVISLKPKKKKQEIDYYY